MQTIKAVARRRWPDDHDGRRFSWYEPIEDEGAIGRAVRWLLAHDQLFLNSTSDGRVLPAVLAAASAAAGSPAPTDAELQADVDALGVEPLFDGRDLERI